jgi:hypothetical protein
MNNLKLSNSLGHIGAEDLKNLSKFLNTMAKIGQNWTTFEVSNYWNAENQNIWQFAYKIPSYTGNQANFYKDNVLYHQVKKIEDTSKSVKKIDTIVFELENFRSKNVYIHAFWSRYKDIEYLDSEDSNLSIFEDGIELKTFFNLDKIVSILDK